MNDRLRGFGGSDVYTLIVGPDKEILSVPKDILIQISHFNTALRSGQFVESQDKAFNLPGNDPKAVADVIFFTYHGQVDYIDIDPEQGLTL